MQSMYEYILCNEHTSLQTKRPNIVFYKGQKERDKKTDGQPDRKQQCTVQYENKKLLFFF
jgi:hypothetical protein